MQLKAKQWQQVRDDLKTKIGEDNFQNWLHNLEIDGEKTEAEADTVVLRAPTRFMRDWVMRHYNDALAEGITDVLKRPVNVVCTVSQPKPAEQEPAAVAIPTAQTEPHQTMAPYHGTPLDPRYTFDNFVTGKSNEFAYAAARRIAETEDLSYNPFVLYGGVGLGKTHLMHAIAHHIRSAQPHRRVLYLSAEKFLYQFIRALQEKSTIKFKETFRNVDVLMIDDVQFIANKVSTQDEFFATFNALTDMRKQVILTADRSPHDMPGIEDRLRSRLGSGLSTQVHAPDMETRLAILYKKAESLNLNLPRDLSLFLADRITSNVRELEGALNRLAAYADLTGAAITVDLAKEHLRDLFQAYNRSISLETIQKKVADYYQIRLADLHGVRRTRTIARPRQVAMYLAKQLTTRSYPEIGRSFGGRDHTTVIHAVRTIDALMEKDGQLRDDVRLLNNMLSAS